MASGFGIASSGASASVSTVGDPSTHDTRNAAGTAAATQAHHRQRADGSDPVGVSSRMKPIQPSEGMKLTEANSAT